MTTKPIIIPDLGGASDVTVIEILVKPGDQINKDDSLITLESEKASMEVPAPEAGTIKSIKLKIGDKVNEGDEILILETAAPTNKPAEKKSAALAEKISVTKPQQTANKQIKIIEIPDIGTTNEVDVIEIAIKPGDKIAKNQTMLTLEGEKASMELPAPYSGTVKKMLVKVGDKVKQNTPILELEIAESVAETTVQPHSVETEIKTVLPAKQDVPASPHQEFGTTPTTDSQADIYASPSVRRYARELGVDLHKITGTGRKGRLVVEDVQAFVKRALAAPTGGIAVAAAPKIDFSKFGMTETITLNKIKRLTGESTHRSWITIPHVTQFDEADITDMEKFRQEQKAEADKQGVKLTPLVFIMKAAVACLKQFPTFNASLDASGQNLILKKYFHIGIAVDTPNGLVVPVIRNVDQKGFFDLAKELAAISKKAREKGLSINEMQGGCFTISSLGGIGGTAFTPIINAPEVAILGVSKAQTKPIYIDHEFQPRLMLPLSLSYDHRVIDGAEAARFIRMYCELLGDIRKLLL